MSLTALAGLLWLLLMGAQLGGALGAAHHPALVKWVAKVQQLHRASGAAHAVGTSRRELLASASASALAQPTPLPEYGHAVMAAAAPGLLPVDFPLALRTWRFGHPPQPAPKHLAPPAQAPPPLA